ncbi:uncharacterized protein [Palaemon carinicauda]|uniref:uncharacterized protein n=1 Tax=Palaemon carinicauda TaxID=392227 RepID=UPI0035B5BD73
MIIEVNIHSHEADAAVVEVAEVKTSLIRRSEDTMEPPSVVINECISVYERVGGREEKFLLADSGPGRGGIFIFGREPWLQYLVTTSLYIDGTFNIPPKLFHQVFAILAEKLGGVHPICYQQLPNKEYATYVRMFEMLMSLVPNLAPHYVHCDFEQAVINTVRKCFPESTIKGCFFHLVQSMQRHIASSGLRRRYNTDPEFATYTKRITALAFVPQADLDSHIDALASELPSDLEPVLTWSECNYVGVYNRRGNRRNPILPYDLWNVYETTLNDEDRTNNYAEACHRKLAYEL